MTETSGIRGFFDEQTNTITYLVWDPASRQAAVIDPVLDYDPAAGTVDTSSAQRVLDAAEEQGLAITHVLETHAHADHLSAAPLFKARTGAKIGIGARIREVQRVFRPMFCADDLKVDGGDFDLLLSDGDRISLGELEIEVIETPGGYTGRSIGCSTFRPRRGSSFATTTRHRGAATIAGRRRWPSSAAMCTSRMA